ncbi:MAG: hypothetical protein H6553_12035 [Chitinophagales bacterium]|nr:hypothetical protein [Chitinophagales bacterium]
MKNLKMNLVVSLIILAMISIISCNKEEDNTPTPTPEPTPTVLSPDTLSFSQTTTSGNIFSARRWHRTTVFNNKIWLVGGELADGYTHDNAVWSSTDGITWNEVLADGHTQFLPVAGGALLTFNNKMWLIGGFLEGARSRNKIWNSSDGITWNEVTTSSIFSARHFFGATVYNNQMWVVGGTNNSSVTGLNDVWSTTDGITWVQHTISSDTFSNRLHNKLVVYNNKLFLISGYSDGNYYNDVWSTTDGNFWTNETENSDSTFVSRYSFESVVYNNSIYVIGGQKDGGSITDEIYKSTDGKNWIQNVITTSYGARRDFQAVLFNNQLLIIGGLANGNITNDIWTLN